MNTLRDIKDIVKSNIIGIQPESVFNTAFEIIKRYDSKLVEGNLSTNDKYINLENDIVSIFYDCLNEYDDQSDDFSDYLKKEDKLFDMIAVKVNNKYFVCD